MIMKKNELMLSNKIILTVGLLSCFFENIQGSWSREQVEEKLGKPVHSFVYMVDLIVMDHWFYTTQLSKILLVGEGPIIETCRLFPVVGPSIVQLISPIFDNRFENFVENIGNYSQRKLREAIQDTLILTGGSSKAYSMSSLLYYLQDALQTKIGAIEDQIKSDSTYDQESVYSLQKSVALATALIAFISVANRYITCDDKILDSKVSDLEGLHALASLGLLPASYTMLKNSYKVFFKDPNARNQYLHEYQDLLEFVQNLNSELKTDGCITFTLDNGNVATVKEHPVLWPFSPYHTLDFA